MSPSSGSIFGSAGGAPASPGSYGEPPLGFRLPDATRLGRVRLQVADLARSLEYYETVLGLRTLSSGPATASLGAHDDSRVLVELHERRDARPAGHPARLGLYHFAILLPDRPSLGRFVRHLADRSIRAGASDHLVSEALYLTDPDGLGIEVYADRPRETWRRVGRELMMATDPIDMIGLTKAAGSEQWVGMPAGTVMGHVHLHVGDIATSAAYFSESLGFDRMVWHYPGALFLGAGGYHHHLGTNTWAGAGARRPSEDDAQLLEWTIELPDAAGVSAVEASLLAGGHLARRDGGSLLSHDPWGTRIRLVALGNDNDNS